MQAATSSIPLAERMRPRSLDDYLGQSHLVGQGAVLRRAIESGNIPSMILWGPPGVGKTTLAFIISQVLKRPFYTLSAINSGVKDVREVIDKVQHGGMFSTSAILFIDEIHRFSKSQQDSLLGAVEKGIVTLIGATTENPSFEVISALLSRSQVYVMKHLEKEDLVALAMRAVTQDAELKKLEVTINEPEALVQMSGGDARRLLNVLELVTGQFSAGPVTITNELVQRTVLENRALYDKTGEMHYDIISAFIKSMRGSDPNAAVYYLARMVDGGEDPKFIARRMLILAAEDIGLANPNALLMADATFRAVENIGWPESRILLSECAIYLATSAKSNSAYMAIEAALENVKQTGNQPVPLHLRNAPTRLMKDIGYGDDYRYAHSYENNFVDQEFLPESLSGTAFYQPAANEKERGILQWLKQRWKGKYYSSE
ncbi:MAG: replication-associated recombination protein A [Flavobacteriales bacterium]|nr:replication-associated recombination protein A [Flavobacteriales bacterium]